GDRAGCLRARRHRPAPFAGCAARTARRRACLRAGHGRLPAKHCELASRRRSESMRQRVFIGALLFSSLFGIGCNRSTVSAPSSEHGAQNQAGNQADKGELVLPVAEQTTVGIQTETVGLSEAPEILRLSGRIALADDRNWHVGVRTEGLVAAVYAGLGDHVKKGQVLARYHAAQVRDLRAQYRRATANLHKA